MKELFTPGPWDFEDIGTEEVEAGIALNIGNGKAIICGIYHDGTVPIESSYADARLIKFAPDMYSVLKMSQDIIGKYGDIFIHGDSFGQHLAELIAKIEGAKR